MPVERFLGVDLGASNTKMIVLEVAEDGHPSVVSTDSVPTRGEEGHDAVIERLRRQ